MYKMDLALNGWYAIKPNQSFVYTQLNGQIFLFDPLMVLYLVLPLRVRVDLGAMAMYGYSIFPKTPKHEPHYQMQFTVISQIVVGDGVLPFYGDVVGELKSPNWLGGSFF